MMVASKAKAFLPKKFKPPSADYQLIGDVDHHPMTRRAHPWHTLLPVVQKKRRLLVE